MERTGNPLDVAIDGKGFLAVQTPRGERYTRNGALQVNNQGQLVTSEGFQVMGEAGPIVMQPNDRDITISPDGTISVREGANAATESQRGKLRLVTFDNPGLLQKDGAEHLRRAGRRAAGGRRNVAHRPGLDREIERARRRRDDAHDRSHAQLHPGRHHAVSSKPICVAPRSRSSPKCRPKAGE